MKKLVLNKNLEIDEDAKKIITTAEGGRYRYFDYTKEKVQAVASLTLEELKVEDGFVLVQALFPKYLICNGIFDNFLMFEIKNGKRVDPPKYFCGNLDEYINNDENSNFLLEEIKDLFEKNEIHYSKDWVDLFLWNGLEVEHENSQRNVDRNHDGEGV